MRFPGKTAAREQGMKVFGLYEADNRQRVPVGPAPGEKTVVLDFTGLLERLERARIERE